MSMIDRYRKKGGFVQLLQLIETTGKDKQDKFMKLIADESPHWEEEVRKKMLTLDRILSWNDPTQAEIFQRIPSLSLAMIVGTIPQAKSQIIINALSSRERKAVEYDLEGKKISVGEANAALTKLFTEVRKLIQEGILRPEKFDEDLVIPEDIEERLGNNRMQAIEREVTQMAYEAQPQNTVHLAPNVVEELTTLRKKMVQLTQENHRLQQENQRLSNENQMNREKLEQIRKIA